MHIIYNIAILPFPSVLCCAQSSVIDPVIQISERAYGDLGTRLKINNRPERVKDRRGEGGRGCMGGGGGGS